MGASPRSGCNNPRHRLSQQRRLGRRARQHVLTGEDFIDPALDNWIAVAFSEHDVLLTA
jgi:hypothetical protein